LKDHVDSKQKIANLRKKCYLFSEVDAVHNELMHRVYFAKQTGVMQNLAAFLRIGDRPVK